MKYRVLKFFIVSGIYIYIYLSGSISITKNIPIPCKDEYEIQLVSKVQKFIEKMRWREIATSA